MYDMYDTVPLSSFPLIIHAAFGQVRGQVRAMGQLKGRYDKRAVS
jgi:hypothetical protein